MHLDGIVQRRVIALHNEVETPYFISGQMRLQLSRNMNILSSDKLIELIAHLRGSIPESVENDEKGGVDINVDMFDMRAFVRIDSMVRRWIVEKKRRREEDENDD